MPQYDGPEGMSPVEYLLDKIKMTSIEDFNAVKWDLLWISLLACLIWFTMRMAANMLKRAFDQ